MKEHNAIYKRYNVEWIGREGLASETHEEYLNDFINHFYKNVLRLVDRAMRKEDTSEQGKIVTEILQHLQSLRGQLNGVTTAKSCKLCEKNPRNETFVTSSNAIGVVSRS